MSKFKIGDKVKQVKSYHPYLALLSSEVGEVTNISTNVEQRIFVDVRFPFSIEDYPFLENELTLYYGDSNV